MIYENKLYAPIKNYSPSIITSKYNEVSSVRNNRQHKGLDLGVQSGTQVLAPQDGTIKTSQITQGNCGGLIEITHANNITTRYCHLKNLNVKVGQTVKAGQVIGLSGGAENDLGKGLSTGAHLHFEVLVGNQFVDPEKYLSGQAAVFTGNTSSDSSNSYNLSNDGITSMTKPSYVMYNPNQQAVVTESIKNDVKIIKEYYKKLNIPILLEYNLFKPSELTDIGKDIVDSFSKKSNKEFSDNYTYQPIGTEFRCQFSRCETTKTGNCHITEIYHNNTTHYIKVCADNFELKNRVARKNDIIATIKSTDDNYSVTVTKGLSTKVELVGDGAKEKKPYKFTTGSTKLSSNKYDLGKQGATDMSSNIYGNLGKQGGTKLSSNKYDLGKGATDMSNNIYGNLGKKGGTSMSEDIYKFDRIHLNEDVIDEINRIRQIL
jgi:biotin carboxyl carrier protein